MPEQDWTSFADDTILADTDVLLVARGAGGINIPGSALLKKDASGNVILNGSAKFGANTTKITSYSDSTYSGWFNGAAISSAEAFFMGAGEAVFQLAGANAYIMTAGSLRPATDNLKTNGTASGRWSVVYAGTGTINTSDERGKKNIGAIPDKWLDAWAGVQWQRFKMKGGTRWHIGLVAQQVYAAFSEKGIDAFAIGLCCFDDWQAEDEPIYATVTKTRKVGLEDDADDEEYQELVDTGKKKRVREAGDIWGLRYDECQAIEAAYQRRRLDQLEAALAALQS